MGTGSRSAGDEPDEVADSDQIAGTAGEFGGLDLSAPSQAETSDVGEAGGAGLSGEAGGPDQWLGAWGAFRVASFGFGSLAIIASGVLIGGLQFYSSGSSSGGDFLSGAEEVMPALGVFLVVINVIIARVVPVWVIVVYAVAATTVVNLLSVSPKGVGGLVELLVWSWVLGLVGMLGTAFGARPLRRPEAERRGGRPDPLPPTSADE
ncbi:MAG: hypothetical protein LBK95_13500 [Bifidobacteriaceae bacterium]|jgi:hypothetical protein|nr:hypothetical protein [Bifidobacteriaceae bacterium]